VREASTVRVKLVSRRTRRTPWKKKSVRSCCEWQSASIEASVEAVSMHRGRRDLLSGCDC